MPFIASVAIKARVGMTARTGDPIKNLNSTRTIASSSTDPVSRVRTAMRATSHLLGRGPTDVGDAPVFA